MRPCWNFRQEIVDNRQNREAVFAADHLLGLMKAKIGGAETGTTVPSQSRRPGSTSGPGRRMYRGLTERGLICGAFAPPIAVHASNGTSDLTGRRALLISKKF